MNDEAAKPSLMKRFLALVVLAVAGFFLVKAVIGLLAGLLTIVLVVLAFVAVIWALRTL